MLFRSLIPGFVFIFIYMLYPLIYSFYLSFTSYNFAFDDKPTFIGFGNYADMWSDSYFMDAFRNTVFFSAAFLPLMMLLSLSVALLINKGLRGTNFFRTSVFLPVIIPLSLTGIIFQWVLNENYGLFNYFIRNVLNMPSWAHNWLTDERYAMWCIIFVSLWKFMGIEVILFIAGLQAIPNSIYEAARIDGANRAVYKRQYQDMAKTILVLDTPGVTDKNLKRLPFQKVSRPVYPLDE